MVVPLFVGREKSIAALEEAMKHDNDILLAAQKKAKTNEPAPDDIFAVGTLGTIIQLLRLPDGTVKVLVEGKQRARASAASSQTDGFFQVEVEEIDEAAETHASSWRRWCARVHGVFESYVKLNKRIPPEMLMAVADHRRSGAARRHHRRAALPQAERQAGDPRDRERRRSGSRSSTS